MLDATNSYKKLKVEQQRIIDFAILVCYSVPNMKKTFVGIKKGVDNFELVVPDFFPLNTKEKYLEKSENYKSNLSKYLIVSSFSFFEAYIEDVCLELLSFHGGRDEFYSFIRNKIKNKVINQSNTLVELKKHINQHFNAKRKQKYEKIIAELNNEANFIFPSGHFSSYGFYFFADLFESGKFETEKIPDLLEFIFGIDLSEKINKLPEFEDWNLRETFDNCFQTRNKIAHEGRLNIGLKHTMDYIRYFRYIALKIDKHLVNNFFILENV